MQVSSCLDTPTSALQSLNHTCASARAWFFPLFYPSMFEELCKGVHIDRLTGHQWNWPENRYCEQSCYSAGFPFAGSCCGMG